MEEWRPYSSYLFHLNSNSRRVETVKPSDTGVAFSRGPRHRSVGPNRGRDTGRRSRGKYSESWRRRPPLYRSRIVHTVRDYVHCGHPVPDTPWSYIKRTLVDPYPGL